MLHRKTGHADITKVKGTKNLKNGKTLYISDLDGTLLDKDAALSETSSEALNRAYMKGAFFSVATARTAATVGAILGDALPTVPSVLQNGVSVYDLRTGEYITTQKIFRDSAVPVITQLRTAGAEPFVYTARGGLSTYYSSLKNSMMREFVSLRIAKFGKKFTVINDFCSLCDDGITYFAVMDDEDTVMRSVSLIKDISGINYTYYRDIYSPDGWYLEIFADTASKKHGVEFLRKNYGFETVVGFGDNLNDLPMFEACDIKIAVGNAAEEVKKAADAVIGPNTEDSVAKFIEKEFYHN